MKVRKMKATNGTDARGLYSALSCVFLLPELPELENCIGQGSVSSLIEWLEEYEDCGPCGAPEIFINAYNQILILTATSQREVRVGIDPYGYLEISCNFGWEGSEIAAEQVFQRLPLGVNVDVQWVEKGWQNETCFSTSQQWLVEIGKELFVGGSPQSIIQQYKDTLGNTEENFPFWAIKKCLNEMFYEGATRKEVVQGINITLLDDNLNDNDEFHDPKWNLERIKKLRSSVHGTHSA